MSWCVDEEKNSAENNTVVVIADSKKIRQRDERQ